MLLVLFCSAVPTQVLSLGKPNLAPDDSVKNKKQSCFIHLPADKTASGFAYEGKFYIGAGFQVKTIPWAYYHRNYNFAYHIPVDSGTHTYLNGFMAARRVSPFFEFGYSSKGLYKQSISFSFNTEKESVFYDGTYSYESLISKNYQFEYYSGRSVIRNWERKGAVFPEIGLKVRFGYSLNKLSLGDCGGWPSIDKSFRDESYTGLLMLTPGINMFAGPIRISIRMDIALAGYHITNHEYLAKVGNQNIIETFVNKVRYSGFISPSALNAARLTVHDVQVQLTCPLSATAFSHRNHIPKVNKAEVGDSVNTIIRRNNIIIFSLAGGTFVGFTLGYKRIFPTGAHSSIDLGIGSGLTFLTTNLVLKADIISYYRRFGLGAGIVKWLEPSKYDRVIVPYPILSYKADPQIGRLAARFNFTPVFLLQKTHYGYKLYDSLPWFEVELGIRL